MANLSTRIRFLGVAAYEIVTRAGQHILVDPFIDENPGAPVKSDSFERVDLVVVSHAAFDHLGDTDKIAARYGCPVICGGEVKAWLMAKGIPAEQIRATTWGIRVEVAGIEVQPVECHHWSQIRMPDGTFASGVPMAFVIYADEGVRFYHYGDTAIFSDMKLQAQLYRPTIGAIGIANPQEILYRNPMPGRMMTGEMSPYEGALAAQWLGLETVLPCHYINPDDPDVHAFERHMKEFAGRGERVPRSVVLTPGDTIEILLSAAAQRASPRKEKLMQAAVFGAPEEIHITDRQRPTPAAGEALILTRAAGLCAGDVHIFKGTNPYVTYPRIGGHEVAGTVVALGVDTDGPKVGSAVVVEPFIGCGHCYPCRIGKSNCCAELQIIGVHRDGGFADYLVAPVDRLHAVPDGLSPFKASFAEPVAIAVQACRRGMVGAGDHVLILGAGPIGLALVEVVRAHGATAYITDIAAERLATAEALGGIPLAAGEGLLDTVLQLTQGEGMPVVIEATGSVAAIELTASLVAAGGRIVIVGLIRKGVGVTFPGLDLTRKEMTIVGSRASVGCFPESLELLASGAIRYPDIATAFPLSDAPEIFADIVGNRKPLHKAIFLFEPA